MRIIGEQEVQTNSIYADLITNRTKAGHVVPLIKDFLIVRKK